MKTNSDLQALKEYIERTKNILELSSPQISAIADAESYRMTLLSSFTHVGELAHLNNDALARHFYPYVNAENGLSMQAIDTMRAFCALLIDTTSMENIDLPMIHRQAERILQEAEETDDLRTKILAWDGMVISSYMMLNLTLRLYPDYDLCFHYRDVGLDAAKKLLGYLDKEAFLSLPDDECRELVLINARYIRCLFEWGDKEDKDPYNTKDLELMRQAAALAEDPFYRESMPHYGWDNHVFRTLQYLADFTEYHNQHEFNAGQLREIEGYTFRLSGYVKAHPELRRGCPEAEETLYRLRNTYLAGSIPLAEYKTSLLDLMQACDRNDYSSRNMFVSFVTVYEYILTLDRENITEEEQNTLTRIYKEMAGYAYHMPKTGALSFMLTFLSELLKHFIEVDDGISFAEMCMKLMAAMHPPTYVHSLSVATFAHYLAGCLLQKAPESFTGCLGTKSTEEVLERKDDLLDFMYESAMLHDVGKLFIVETIITYGRHLMNEEFALIKAHSQVGASLLEGSPSTVAYAEAARGHHKWYDNRGGYPETFDMTRAKNPAIIHILTVADCLDAATDAVGRSYKAGKTLPDVIAELKEGSGTRYAPYVVDLFRDPEVTEHLERLLKEKRDENYRKTYQVLKEL